MPLPTTIGNLGPGVVKFGMTGTLIDVSCQVNNIKISADVNQGDSTTKVGGCVRAGAVTYTPKISGNLDTDIGAAAGFFALSWEHAGEVIDFEFTPDNDQVTKAVGSCVVNPLDFGADEAMAPLVSDFEFVLEGMPVFTYGIPLGADLEAAV
jgi:hypothetical protein